MYLQYTNTDGACKVCEDLKERVCVDEMLDWCAGELIIHKACSWLLHLEDRKTDADLICKVL